MKTLVQPTAILVFSLVAINQMLERFGIIIPFIHSYLDDVLCFPLMLTVGLAMYRIFWPQYQLGAWHIWPLFLIVVVYFEFVLPTKSSVYTSDPFDIAAYLIGIIWFNKTLNKPLESTRNKKPRLERG